MGYMLMSLPEHKNCVIKAEQVAEDRIEVGFVVNVDTLVPVLSLSVTPAAWLPVGRWAQVIEGIYQNTQKGISSTNLSWTVLGADDSLAKWVDNGGPLEDDIMQLHTIKPIHGYEEKTWSDSTANVLGEYPNAVLTVDYDLPTDSVHIRLALGKQLYVQQVTMDFMGSPQFASWLRYFIEDKLGEAPTDGNAKAYAFHTGGPVQSAEKYLREYRHEAVDVLSELFDLRQATKCPECKIKGRLLGAIPHLNDEHHWTREEIADWMESQDFDLTMKVSA